MTQRRTKKDKSYFCREVWLRVRTEKIAFLLQFSIIEFLSWTKAASLGSWASRTSSTCCLLHIAWVGPLQREKPLVSSHHMASIPQTVSLYLADTRASYHLSLSTPQFWKFQELQSGLFQVLKAVPSKESWQQSPENNLLKWPEECLNS